jgi:hypothetical protein
MYNSTMAENERRFQILADVVPAVKRARAIITNGKYPDNDPTQRASTNDQLYTKLSTFRAFAMARASEADNPWVVTHVTGAGISYSEADTRY